MHRQRKTNQNDSIFDANTEYLTWNTSHLNLCDIEEMTELHQTVMCGNKILTKFYINNGCSVNIQNSLGVTPLNLAIEFGHFEIAEMLLLADAEMPVSKQVIEAVFMKILSNFSKVPRYVCVRFYKQLKSKAPFSEIITLIEKSNCPLDHVIIMQDACLTRAILERRNELSLAESVFSILDAMDSLDLNNIEALMNYGENRLPRIYCFFKCIKVIKNAERENMLEDSAVLTVLFKQLPNWDIWDESTIMWVGVIFEEANVEVLEILITHEIHVCIKNQLGIDVLAHCFGNSSPGVAKYMEKLVEDKCIVPKSGLGGKCGLHFAMNACIIENVKLLSKMINYSYSQINYKDEHGCTPLFEVFHSTKNISKKSKCVIQLLVFGGELQIFDNFGYHWLDLHLTDDDWPIIQIMLAHLAMLESLGITIDKTIRLKIQNNKLYDTFYAGCHKQLKEMIEIKLCPNITAYRFMTVDVFDKSIRYVRSGVLQFLKSNNYFKKFTFYYWAKFAIIINYYESINDGRNNLSSAICECNEVFSYYPLIVDCVLSYFSIKFIKSFSNL